MKKILIFSDSHGKNEAMISVIEKETPDMIIHLGDCMADTDVIRAHFPEIPLENVPGNCDCSMAATEKILEIEGQRILICHGHKYSVKRSLLSLQFSAMEKQADIALFGHTHRVFYDWNNGVRMFNPGSIGSPGYRIPPSYGIMVLDEETGTVSINSAYIEPGK